MTLLSENNIFSERLKNTTVENILGSLGSIENSTKLKIDKGHQILQSVKKEVEVLSPKVGLIKGGLYPPVFKYDDSDQLKSNILEIREKQLKFIKNDNAVNSLSSLAWFGDKQAGSIVLTAYRRLIIVAFNSEFDSIRKQMRSATYKKAEEKLYRLRDQLEKLGETVNISIANSYYKIKIEELKAWHEELEKKEHIKNEQKKQREVLREQNKKLSKNIEKLEDEVEYKYSDLKKAQNIANNITREDRIAIDLEIEKIKHDIRALEEKYTREISQAQITRAGYIYVISNIGSFGEGIIKIGMTRRLEPMDRVNELGDASVPFKFDVHTLTFSEDAPELENRLHKLFDDKRVNTENRRKEFFRASPKDVKNAMADLNVNAEWYFEAEAKEYNESKLLRKAIERNKGKEESPSIANTFPKSI